MSENAKVPLSDRTVSSARKVAWDVLTAVRESDAYANLVLPVRIERAALTTADAALATELTYGTLRMQGYYDRVIALASRRETELIDPPVLTILRLGVHQILATRIPPHAAVNESVNLTRQIASAGATRFVNGVLRTVTRLPAEEWRERVSRSASSPEERQSILTSHPAWIVRAYTDALRADGRDGECDALLAANNVPPRVTLVALPGHARRLEGTEHTIFSPIGFTLEGGDPLPIVRDSRGTIRVQDEGSQLAALVLSRARPVIAGERWLDMCAGPGGKAAVLAAEARLGGAEFIANEPTPSRAGLVRGTLHPIDPTIPVWERDGRDLGAQEPEGFDRILLDAPCTGLGALRRRPEARWRKSPRDVAELTRVQQELIDSALAALKPGGILVYVTCSPHLAETRGIIQGVLARHRASLAAMDTPAILRTIASQSIDSATNREDVQLWPHRHGTDAMFIAALTRRTEGALRP